jgi:thymidylate synthase
MYVHVVVALTRRAHICVSEDLLPPGFERLLEGGLVVLDAAAHAELGASKCLREVPYLIHSGDDDAVDSETRRVKGARIDRAASRMGSWKSCRTQDSRESTESFESDLTQPVPALVSPRHMVVLGGGAGIYVWALSHAPAVDIHATIVEDWPAAGDPFPAKEFEAYELVSISDAIPGHDGTPMRYAQYLPVPTTPMMKIQATRGEQGYLDLLREILASRSDLRPDRTGVGTRSVFSRQLRFDVSGGRVPFLTTKQLAWKSVLRELLFFLSGRTDTNLLEAQGVRIWRANTSRAFLDARGLAEYHEGDMGPMYGFQWRHYGAEYRGCDADYAGQGHDQLAELLAGLRSDPYSRRHLLTTYNPAAVASSVLAPCHGIAVMFYVHEPTPEKKTLETPETPGKKGLSCHVFIRSSDAALGLPFNIASYAILLRIIAAQVDMDARELIVTTGDTHIYGNALAGTEQQIARDPLPSPILRLSDDVARKDISELCEADFELVGYLHHPPISMPMAV